MTMHGVKQAMEWGRDPLTICGTSPLCRAVREETCLGLNVVGDVVNGTPEGDFSDWPRSIVGQVGGQNADPQLALCRTDKMLPLSI